MERIKSPLVHFKTLVAYPDERYVTHSLINIIAISLLAIICGGKDWYEVANFGNCKLHWLNFFLDIDKEAYYILAVKGNQKLLYQDIKEAFENEKNIETYSSSTVGHRRIETRITKVISTIRNGFVSQKTENCFTASFK